MESSNVYWIGQSRSVIHKFSEALFLKQFVLSASTAYWDGNFYKVSTLSVKKFLSFVLNLPLPNVKDCFLGLIFKISGHNKVSSYGFCRLQPYPLLGVFLSKLKSPHSSVCQLTDTKNCEGSEILHYCKLTNQPATVSWMLAESTRLLG